MTSEKIGERKLRLFFYNKFTLVGEKLFVSHNKIRTNFSDSDVPNLFSAFNFLLTQKSYTIYEDDVLAQLGIDFDPNREYRWTGDFIQVSSNRKNIESEPYLETIGRLKVFLPNFSPDNIILNSISDYYFFPKPEVQE